LLLVGFIILSSVRLILERVGRVLRVSSRTLSAAFLLLLLAQLMGSYVLSTIVQIRTSFPPMELSPESNLFATLPAYQMFGALFDGSFLAAACLTAVSLWARARLGGATIF